MAKTTVALKKKGAQKAPVPSKKKEVTKAVKTASTQAKKSKELISPKSVKSKASVKKSTVKAGVIAKKSTKKAVINPKVAVVKSKKKSVSSASNVKSTKVSKVVAIAKKKTVENKLSKSKKVEPKAYLVSAKKSTEKKAVTAKKASLKTAQKPINSEIEKVVPVITNQIPDKKPRIKNVLISQAYPENGKSPFIDIANKWKLKVDFRSFIQVEGLTAKEFRRLRINVTDYTAIIFNSRNAIHYFFKLCEEMRVKLSPDMKYFCTSEAIALYLQKYIHYRKRKVFYEYANKTLFEILSKHKDNEKFLYPCSKDRKDDIPNFLQSKKFNYAEAFIYQTVPSDLSDLKSIKYDVIIFFSPVGIKSLMHNYPDFKQEDRRIGAFGQVTHDAVRATFRLDIIAPTPVAHSMAQALENYLKESNGKPS